MFPSVYRIQSGRCTNCKCGRHGAALADNIDLDAYIGGWTVVLSRRDWRVDGARTGCVEQLVFEDIMDINGALFGQ